MAFDSISVATDGSTVTITDSYLSDLVAATYTSIDVAVTVNGTTTSQSIVAGDVSVDQYTIDATFFGGTMSVGYFLITLTPNTGTAKSGCALVDADLECKVYEYLLGKINTSSTTLSKTISTTNISNTTTTTTTTTTNTTTTDSGTDINPLIVGILYEALKESQNCDSCSCTDGEMLYKTINTTISTTTTDDCGCN